MSTPHTPEQLYSEVTKTLTSLFGISADKISLEASLVKDLDLDSIDMVDLLSTASDHFAVDLTPFEFEGVRTIGEFISRLDSELNKKASKANG